MKKYIFSWLIILLVSLVAVSCSTKEKAMQENLEETQMLKEEISESIENDLVDYNDAMNYESQEEEQKNYDNPIDAYFLPKINSKDTSQAEIRAAQDTYRAVWASEFKNLMKWMRKKCVYQEDKKKIRAMEKRVKRNVELSKDVIATELLNIYEINPDSNKNKDSDARSWHWGNGTRSRLNQIQGEMYRDASMRIIELHNDAKDGGYEFRDIDYSKVASEGGDTFYYLK